MTNREKLIESYEDAALALLMDEFAKSEGRRYIEENERLRQDPSAAVPSEVEQRALRRIRREFAQKDRAHTGRTLLRVLGQVAIAALIVVLLFGAAFALSETVRAGTLNFLIQIDERIATWQFGEDVGSTSDGQSGAMDIVVDWLPKGYTRQALVVSGPTDMVLDCTDDAGGLIRVQIHASEDFMHTIDMEDADYYREIVVQDCEGMLRIKDDIIRVAWFYQDSDLVVAVVSSDVDMDALLRVAEGVNIIW